MARRTRLSILPQMPAKSSQTTFGDFDFSEPEPAVSANADEQPALPVTNRFATSNAPVLPAQYLTTSDEPDTQDDPRLVAQASLEDVQDGLASLSTSKPSRRGSSSSASNPQPTWSGETFEKQRLSGLDAAFVRFQERVFVRAAGDLADQVLRYDRGGEPLPFSGAGAAYDRVFPGKVHSPRGIERCQACGAGRTFELQVMPQLVTVLSAEGLLKEREDELELGWATVWCYCCAADCTVEGGWSEEVAVVQYEEAGAPEATDGK
jgi:pre-rRNA-processing protein TSR4